MLEDHHCYRCRSGEGWEMLIKERCKCPRCEVELELELELVALSDRPWQVLGCLANKN